MAITVLMASIGPGATKAAHPALTPPPASAPAAHDSSAADRVSRFALNVLLAPLIDDGRPPRWTDLGLNNHCGPTTRVEIDGRPLVPGASIPAGAFTVHWDMDLCWPFGVASLVLSGIADLRVDHADRGLVAIVSAPLMVISSAVGTSRLGAPFAASLDLDTTEAAHADECKGVPI